MQPKSCLLPEPVILQAEGLSCSVSSRLHQVCLSWEPSVSKSISPTRLGVSEGHRVCAREACVLRLASGRNLVFTSNTQEILTRRDRRVSGEDHLTCSEVKASQDLPRLLRGYHTTQSSPPTIWFQEWSHLGGCHAEQCTNYQGFHHALWSWPRSVRSTMFCINASWKL